MAEVPHNYEDDLLRQYENWSVYLHENQTYVGRTYVALAREGEVDPFIDTTSDERSELLVIMGSLKGALDKLYQPDLLNYANLRNTWKHCHWHVIPRYNTGRLIMGHTFEDPNWGRNYAPYPASTVPNEVYEKIKADLATELASY
jgi:diadenosine tetraphosphate (Ap4A) HIT family hydrolase